MTESIGRIIGILAVVVLAAALLFVIEIQPRVEQQEEISLEVGHGNTPEHDLQVTHTEQPTSPNVKMEIVLQEWGFIVDGQVATISPEGTLKGALPVTVNVGDIVQITLINKGKIVHDLNIALGEGEHLSHEAMEHQAQSILLKPGETEIITFIAIKAGVYSYHCSIPGHTELGMLGTLVVIGEDAEHDPIEQDDEDHHEE